MIFNVFYILLMLGAAVGILGIIGEKETKDKYPLVILYSVSVFALVLVLLFV